MQAGSGTNGTNGHAAKSGLPDRGGSWSTEAERGDGLQVVLRDRWPTEPASSEGLEVVLREEGSGRDRAEPQPPLDLTVPLLDEDLLTEELSPDLTS